MKKKFHEGDWELLFDSWYKDFKGNFYVRSMGPYEINIVYDNGSMKICTIDGDKTPLLVNGHQLHLYQKPISKKEFIKNLVTEEEVEIVKTVAYLLSTSTP
jgi:hypothetical protein